jgi:multidrug efflux pump subunit AcrB
VKVKPGQGIAGRLAAAWIHSKLTPLVIAASLMLGVFAVLMLPREEEPQIIVPMIDLFVQMPGSTAAEVEQRVTRPLEQLLNEIPGVEYIYSTSSPGMALVIVRFKVGQDEEKAIVRLNQKVQANLDRMPPGVSMPLVKPRSIDDVPVLALTLHSSRYNDTELRAVAAQLADGVKQVGDVSEVQILGGQRRELRVTLDGSKLGGYGLTPLAVMQALGQANRTLRAGASNAGNVETMLEAGGFLRDAADAERVVVASTDGRPVYLRDVARVEDTGVEPTQYVQFARAGHFESAVTLSIAKRKGTNAITVATDVLRKVDALKPALLPRDIELSITRQYGETAAEKSNELLLHMAIAIVSVSLLIAFVLGWRESLIVFTAIPVTLALTLTVFYLYGYTLNRITLFALIFSIGILVDDAIVIVENIVRHARMPSNAGKPLTAVAIEAVDEVGNPTILATLTVIAAILPMAFVGGLMGPYMRPIPIGATAAMVFSLLVAFVVTPWAAVRILKPHQGHGEHEREDVLTRFYRRFMHGLLTSGIRRYLFLGGVVVLLLGSMALVAIEFVKVKMLPFDNKSEFQVIIDMPAGTTLEQSARVARALAERCFQQPEVVDVQTYAGTAAPYNFNGLVRHYYLRRGANVADIQVNLKGKSDRSASSHEIAKRVRTSLLPLAAQFHARIKVAEVPPGPPVLETLVAEIYGPSKQGREKLAAGVLDIFDHTDGVVDADWYVEAPQPKQEWRVDQEKAALAGVSVDEIAQTLAVASGGASAGLMHVDNAREPVAITLRLDDATRSETSRLAALKVAGRAGLVPLSELVHIESATVESSIYHKNLMPVTYVTADVAGAMESPVYAILQLGPKIAQLPVEGGYQIEQLTAHQPNDDARYAMKWDGEWHITYEVFRDLGIAFAAVLVLIYVLVVGWFQSFTTPLIIMAAIPFSLVGILPAHGLLGAFFTATSMIGFIAGAGIVVRNSIILVDFIELRLKQGMALEQAVVDAGAVRFRPMLLTAAAVVVGSTVILFDPIFQGLAIALMAGEIASLALSRVTVPIVYYVFHSRAQRARADGVEEGA